VPRRRQQTAGAPSFTGGASSGAGSGVAATARITGADEEADDAEPGQAADHAGKTSSRERLRERDPRNIVPRATRRRESILQGACPGGRVRR